MVRCRVLRKRFRARSTRREHNSRGLKRDVRINQELVARFLRCVVGEVDCGFTFEVSVFNDYAGVRYDLRPVKGVACLLFAVARKVTPSVRA